MNEYLCAPSDLAKAVSSLSADHEERFRARLGLGDGDLLTLMQEQAYLKYAQAARRSTARQRAEGQQPLYMVNVWAASAAEQHYWTACWSALEAIRMEDYEQRRAATIARAAEFFGHRP